MNSKLLFHSYGTVQVANGAAKLNAQKTTKQYKKTLSTLHAVYSLLVVSAMYIWLAKNDQRI